jgi:hypothetical protein
MSSIKEFLKSKWAYKLTDNQLFAFEGGIVAMSMGSSFLLVSLLPSLFDGDIQDIVLASVILGIGLGLTFAMSYVFHKTREEIERPKGG